MFFVCIFHLQFHLYYPVSLGIISTCSLQHTGSAGGRESEKDKKIIEEEKKMKTLEIPVMLFSSVFFFPWMPPALILSM